LVAPHLSSFACISTMDFSRFTSPCWTCQGTFAHSLIAAWRAGASIDDSLSNRAKVRQKYRQQLLLVSCTAQSGWLFLHTVESPPHTSMEQVVNRNVRTSEQTVPHLRLLRLLQVEARAAAADRTGNRSSAQPCAPATVAPSAEARQHSRAWMARRSRLRTTHLCTIAQL
jgi:hypothetical protein